MLSFDEFFEAAITVDHWMLRSIVKKGLTDTMNMGFYFF
jgi:hypothetical protein